MHVGEGDRLSISWLYTFPQGKTVAEIASKYGVSGSDIDEVVSRIISKQTKTEYNKVGSRWKETEKTEKETTIEFYCNVFDAVPFFKNLGGYERVEMKYTIAGYIPIISTSISRDKEKKVIRKYIIERR